MNISMCNLIETTIFFKYFACSRVVQYSHLALKLVLHLAHQHLEAKANKGGVDVLCMLSSKEYLTLVD